MSTSWPIWIVLSIAALWLGGYAVNGLKGGSGLIQATISMAVAVVSIVVAILALLAAAGLAMWARLASLAVLVACIVMAAKVF